jgi:hypothetical protein
MRRELYLAGLTAMRSIKVICLLQAKGSNWKSPLGSTGKSLCLKQICRAGVSNFETAWRYWKCAPIFSFYKL